MRERFRDWLVTLIADAVTQAYWDIEDAKHENRLFNRRSQTSTLKQQVRDELTTIRSDGVQ